MPALSSGGRAVDESVSDNGTGGSASGGSASASITSITSTSTSNTSGLQVPVARFDGQNTAEKHKKGNGKRKAEQGDEGEGSGPERFTAGGMRLRLVVLHVLKCLLVLLEPRVAEMFE